MKKHLLVLLLLTPLCMGITYNSGTRERERNLVKPEAEQVLVVPCVAKDSQGNKVRYFMGIIRINAATDKVWDAMRGRFFKGFSEPGIMYSNPIYARAAKGTAIVDGRFDMPLFDPGYTIFVRAYQDTWRIEWSLLTKHEVKTYQEKGIYVKPSSSCLKSFEGHEYLKTSPDGKGTLYYRAIAVKSKVPVPVFVKREITERLVNSYMEGLKQEVETRQGPEYDAK